MKNSVDDKAQGMMPYEKCEAYGFESLTDEELLAIIIRSGTKSSSCMETAAGLIRQTEGQGIIGLQRLSLRELSALPGIGRVKAVQLKSICELSRRMARQRRAQRPNLCSAQAVVDYLMEGTEHLLFQDYLISTEANSCRFSHRLHNVRHAARG